MPRCDEQGIRVARRDNCVTMCEAYSQRAMRDNFRDGQVGGVGVEVAADDLEIGSDRAEEFVGGRVGEIAEAEDLANFSGSEELFKLFVPKV